MAHGYPDYFRVSNVGLSTPVFNQTLFLEYDTGNLTTSLPVDLVQYTTPADTYLYVTGGYIGINYPATYYLYVLVGGVTIFMAPFNTLVTLPFSPSAMIKVDPETKIRLQAYNGTGATRTFYAALIGYTIPLVAGSDTENAGVGFPLPAAGQV